jgi:hypothetical protein
LNPIVGLRCKKLLKPVVISLASWLKRLKWPAMLLILATFYALGTRYYYKPVIKFSSDVVNEIASYTL